MLKLPEAKIISGKGSFFIYQKELKPNTFRQMAISIASTQVINDIELKIIL